MTERSARISNIVVAGGGIVGWSAAATIRRRIPGTAVTLVAVPPPLDALADRMNGTLPSAVEFHRDIGIDEADLLQRTAGCFRLGTRFEEWSEGLPPYFHGYGECGRAMGGAAFHQHWLRATRRGSAASFGSHSLAAAIAGANRFVHPVGDPASPLSSFEYGLSLDPARYRDYLRAYARHLGVVERPGPIDRVALREDGFVASLSLADGSELAGDLFVDCTGPAAVIHSALDGGFEDWSAWLPCDRLLFGEAPPAPDLPVFDRAIATAAGWRWEAASPARLSHGLVYASAHLSDGKAERVLRGATAAATVEPPVRLRAGRRPKPWLRNCVAIGDAAVAVEPLEATNLHLAHSAIDRLVAMMPGRDCAAVELSEYNRQCTAEADRVRDFLALHYILARRPKDAFWREAASAPPPPSLAHTLELFAERGVLPFYEEETFPRDSWLAVLIGQGLRPRRPDPMAAAVPLESAEAAMSRIRAGIAAMVPRLPTHSAYLRNLPARASS